ncbi:hypothetical protein NIES4071_109790 (plasmid) [Calothrix sp. NIES-4071]|nr:hypothetical protein NIES4071_109790 [Calothrix sp. NIES-4071]BAZ65256.1 hypothetical protein NIES4105_109890 [Calothrix sp. NIES-4105]
MSKGNRGKHPRSLENLSKGAEARRGEPKEKHLYNILPRTHQWLSQGGNASGALDELVRKLLEGELVEAPRIKELEEKVRRLEELAKLGDKYQALIEGNRQAIKKAKTNSLMKSFLEKLQQAERELNEEFI